LNVLTAMAHIMQHLGPHSWVPIVEQKEVSPHSWPKTSMCVCTQRTLMLNISETKRGVRVQ